MSLFASVPWFAVGVATVVQFILGAMWYSALFERQFVAGLKAEGHIVFSLSDEKRKEVMAKFNMLPPLLSSLFGAATRALSLALLLQQLKITDMCGATCFAAMMWFGFVLSYVHHNVWTMRNMTVTCIDQSLELVGAVVQAAILVKLA